MINRQTLLSDLQKLLQRLEADLLERSQSAEVPEVGQSLRAEYDRARTAERTAQNYEDWRTDAITQAAAAWVLSCVFVRFLEDNRLIDPPKMAGPAERLERSRDEHELYFRSHPTQTDREYLLAVFDQLGKLPGTKDVFGEHNPIRELPNWLSGDAAGELLRFFQKIDANAGTLVHDFTDPNWDTRFLGDLYQDLSEAARKKYALLQTPEFVEEFILDRTLDPALDEFGLDAPPVLDSSGNPITAAGFRMIDPACGSGHFLLGAFPRILERWQRKEPGTNVRELVQRALDSVCGVDVNPYAIAIARFRLLLAGMRACGIEQLEKNVPGFRMNLVCGDSLLHAPLSSGQQVFDFDLTDGDTECEHAYQSEDLPVLKRMLRGGRYHAVVANPPYIVPRDKQLNDRYRKRFASCYRQYSLAVPFLERIFRLAVSSGYTGQITANSFMKREFGKKLIEAFFPTMDLTYVIDTAGAYIPGHGTPTVILFGRNRPPIANTLRTVMGIRGEPATPNVPAQGLVWSAITAQVDHPGSHGEFVSVGDADRELFHKHPWSIGGGGAAELKVALDEGAPSTLGEQCDAISSICLTREDEAYLVPLPVLKRRGVKTIHRIQSIQGEQIRDWCIDDPGYSLFPYDANLCPELEQAGTDVIRFLWERREYLWRRREPNGDHRELNRTWWEWSRFLRHRMNPKTSIAMAFVATHNHFVLDRDKTVFNRSAPVIKLPETASDHDYLGLLGCLNSSIGCFWMKQIFHDKGSTVDSHGARQTTVAFEGFREFAATGLLKFPISAAAPVSHSQRLDNLSKSLRTVSLPNILRSGELVFAALSKARIANNDTLGQMIVYQEDLDWECYRLYGLIAEDLTPRCEGAKENSDQEKLGDVAPVREPPPLKLGQRAFEIVLARKMAAGEMQTTWFDRHGSTPITELPAEWPDDYRQLVERRIALIESDPNIRLIEQPEYKRRWNTEPWESQLERALREWLLDRLESYFDFDGRMKDLTPKGEGANGDKKSEPLNADAPLREISLYSVAKLADVARGDAEFQQVGELYRDDPAFDVQALVTELVAVESVPLLPVLRYKPSGLIKRGTWERTWDLQRQEDVIDARTKLPNTDPEHLTDAAARERKQQQIGNIPVPTKYDSKDFLNSDLWRLRGKLDVPKERWISFPHCEGPDGTAVIAWAGYDHLQQARAISGYYVRVQTEFGGSDDPRLIPLLAGLIELIPWLKQWHNEPDAEFDGMRMGDYFEGFVSEEARQFGKTLPEIKAWERPMKEGAKAKRGKGAKGMEEGMEEGKKEGTKRGKEES